MQLTVLSSLNNVWNGTVAVLEAACGEYGAHHVERMVAAVENGRCHRWTPHYQQQQLSASESKHIALYVSHMSQQQTRKAKKNGRVVKFDIFRCILTKKYTQLNKYKFSQKFIKAFCVLVINYKIIKNVWKHKFMIKLFMKKCCKDGCQY